MSTSPVNPLPAATPLPAVVDADLVRLVGRGGGTVARNEPEGAGGELSADTPEVIVSDLVLRPWGDALEVCMEQPVGRLEATPRALGLPGNWRDYDRLELTVETQAPVRVELVAVLPRGRLGTAVRAEPGAACTLTLDLRDLPLATGVRPLYEPDGVRLLLQGLAGVLPRLRLRSLRLVPRVEPREPVVDALGQRRHATWPGKARTVEELRARAHAEAVALSGGMATREPGDRYGGWKEGPRFEATGRFRVERDPAGRWWFVTPDGNPYWALGATGVRLDSVNDTTRACGREALFEELPAPGEEGWFTGVHPSPAGEVSLRGNVHLYRWNAFRKYGSAEAWRERVLARWKQWGLNSFGAWSDERLCAQQRVPYTRFLQTRALPGAGPTAGVFADVWDPRWTEAVDVAFARDTAAGQGQSWLLGYFVDNEAPWREMRLLDIAPDAHLRSAWLDVVRERYASVTAFNLAHGTVCADWEAVRRVRTPELRAAGTLLAELEARYAERYFATVARLLRKHAPGHLYLGCRFVRVPPADGIIAAAGRHVDVLSVNCYARSPDPQAFAQWHRTAGGRPVLIGEFHFPLASARQLPPLWEAFPEQERESMVTTFVEGWARQPWSIGCHWYQHADQPVLGRHFDGENQTVGLVDLTDTPYEHLVRAFRTASARMYGWHVEPRHG